MQWRRRRQLVATIKLVAICYIKSVGNSHKSIGFRRAHAFIPSRRGDLTRTPLLERDDVGLLPQSNTIENVSHRRQTNMTAINSAKIGRAFASNILAMQTKA
jgi:hypothetical protein